jgi:formate-dependent phosphoribosylglycinamide formyltransferase (GAR transformylase)
MKRSFFIFTSVAASASTLVNGVPNLPAIRNAAPLAIKARVWRNYRVNYLSPDGKAVLESFARSDNGYFVVTYVATKAMEIAGHQVFVDGKPGIRHLNSLTVWLAVGDSLEVTHNIAENERTIAA